MFKLPRAVLLGLVVVLTPAIAWPQMNFEGLDLGNKKKKKKKATTDDTGTKTDGSSSEVKIPEGGLDLSKPADKGSSPAMSFDAVDVSGKGADRQRLDAALKEFKAENYETAALQSFDLMQDPKMAGLAVESQYLLAKSLYRMNMFHSSLGEFSKILAHGPQTKFFKSSLEWLFFISRKTVNEQVVLDEIAKYSNYDFPEKFKSEFHYLLARYYFVRGKALDDAEQKGEADKSFEEVKRLVLMIPKNDIFFPRGKYLEGLAYFRENKLEAALDAMKEVVRETRPPNGPITAEVRANLQLRELAFMQLARTHYGARQNRYAIFYFNKVERGSAQWLEALFESSWASYRIGKYEQSLGNLITLAAPFFRDEYFPEALILKAVIYFENCRYREALSIIEDYERIYGPVQDELAALVGKNMEATEYYNVLADVQKKKENGEDLSATEQILERILKLALTDQGSQEDGRLHHRARSRDRLVQRQGRQLQVQRPVEGAHRGLEGPARAAAQEGRRHGEGQARVRARPAEDAARQWPAHQVRDDGQREGLLEPGSAGGRHGRDGSQVPLLGRGERRSHVLAVRG